MTGEQAGQDGAKKIKILAAAKELFGRFGFKKTTVDEIATGAGVSKRTIYEVFSSKEQILADLVVHEALTFRKSCLVQIRQAGDAREKLRILFDMSTQYFDENPFLGQVLADDQRLYEPFLGDEIDWVEQGIKGIIASILDEGVQQGVFRSMNVPAVAQCVLVLFRGFTYQKTSREDGNSEWVPFVMHAISAPE
ncbi:MAG: TetR/AcrR family transcriptional regulator [Anaerolineae bacterium]